MAVAVAVEGPVREGYCESGQISAGAILIVQGAQGHDLSQGCGQTTAEDRGERHGQLDLGNFNPLVTKTIFFAQS